MSFKVFLLVPGASVHLVPEQLKMQTELDQIFHFSSNDLVFY